MPEKPSSKSSQRSRQTKTFLSGQPGRQGLFTGLSLPDLLTGVGIAVVVSFLLAGIEFQSLPDYQVGDIADRTIEAPFDFTAVDRQATLRKQEEVRSRARAVFDLDLRLNNRIMAELRGAFAEARRRLAEARIRSGNSKSLTKAVEKQILSALRETLPRFTQGEVLAICLRNEFSPDLENQMVTLIQEAMKPPGVVRSRDALLGYQTRGVILRNTITGEDELVNDWMAIRDLEQARDLLRQNEYQLTSIVGEEKKEIIAFLEDWIFPNVYYNGTASLEMQELLVDEVDPVLIQVKRGRTLVRAGDEIGSQELLLLEQLGQLRQPGRWVEKFSGIFLLTGFFLFAVWQYLSHNEKRKRKIRKHYALLAVVVVLTLIVTRMFMVLADLIASSRGIDGFQDPMNLYFLAPMALGTILLMLLVTPQISVLYSLVFSVFVGLMSGESSLFIYSLTGSLAAIHLMDHYRDRAAVIKGGVLIGLVNVVTVLGLHLYAVATGFQWMAFLVRVSSGLLSGLVASMLAFLFLPILEHIFKITTDIRLLELSNLNNPVLRRLAVEAPGTYHHSIVVGTLAESAAEAIGANPLLVRVGAYYHDIGKLKTPEYYVENQIYSANKHEQLSPSMSSLILASHVKDGLAIADEIKLVREVKDLIPQHHGTRLMKYFLHKAREASEGKERQVNENDFRYPGPKPQTREAAILMLADQVEAAARTLQEPGPTQVRGLIKRLIQSTIQEEQFNECDITMRDLDRILAAFERVITGIHHHRIPYPGFDFTEPVPEKQQLEATQLPTHRVQ